MVNVFYDENNNVNIIYYVDLPEELISLPHFSLEGLPEPKNIEDKESVLKCDGKKVWYDYVDKELSSEELLKQQIDILSKMSEFLASENEAKDDLLQEIILQLYL